MSASPSAVRAHRRRNTLTLRRLLAPALAVWLTAPAGEAAAQRVPPAVVDSPSVLVVIAHPDDDAMFAGTVYKITHALGGAVDVALITDGSGGFRYAQLAEPIYGLPLTDEHVARTHLPAIRKRELMAGGAIVGVRNYHFLDELDDAYTESIDSVLTYTWNAERVRAWLIEVMRAGAYDFVFVHLPIERFHGHHKAATVLALEAATAIPGGPVVLGAFFGATPDDTTHAGFEQHPGYPITRVLPDAAPFTFDLTEPLSPDGRLDYRIVVNWLIAEHKSQGTMQLLMNFAAVERYWYFAANGPERVPAAAALFERLAAPVPPDGR